MSIPPELRRDLDAFPPPLRALLEAELAAGNTIVEVGHSFPAPPAGAYVKLASPVSTRPRRSGDDLDFYDRDSSLYSGEFTDAQRFFFVLEPPHPPPPELDMEAIRAGRQRPGPASGRAPRPPTAPAAPPDAPRSPLQRFRRSMVIDYEKWHDGIGYDLDALHAASGDERAAIETLLIARNAADWRDVEGLAALGTARARAALQTALKRGDHEVRLAVIRFAPELVPQAARVQSLVAALEGAELYAGLSAALDQVEKCHPPAVVDALLRGALARDGEVAVNFAAMLLYLHGRAEEPFDWAQRPFFLRFHTTDRAARETVFRELCDKIAVDPARYLQV